MDSSGPIRLKIITPERTVYNEMVNHVVLPAVDGEIGIFHHHAPIISYLKPGRLRIHLQDLRIICLSVNKGLFEFKDESVTILTTEKISKEDVCIDIR